MKREHIIIIVVLLILVGSSFGVFQFYVKPRLAIYNKDQIRAKSLETKLDELQQAFNQFRPEVIVSAWKGEVQPWTDAVFARAPFFTMENAFELPEPVPDGMMLKFYYDEKSREMVEAIRKRIREHVPYCDFPTLARFGAPEASAFAKMSKNQVETGLRIINYGGFLVDLLLKSKAVRVDSLEIWPRRLEYDNLLRMYTVGIHFQITMENLVKFIEEELRLSRRYFSINAISIQNRMLSSPQTPLLDVRMLLTQSQFVTKNVGAAGDAAPAMPGMPPQPGSDLALQGLQPGMQPGMGMQMQPGMGTINGMQPPPPGMQGGMGMRRRGDLTKWEKFVKWLKFNFWPF